MEFSWTKIQMVEIRYIMVRKTEGDVYWARIFSIILNFREHFKADGIKSIKFSQIF